MKTRLLQVAALAAAVFVPIAASAQVNISVNLAPPPLPVYEQPPVPGDGYIWTPGYWSWSPSMGSYHWVPGTWVLAPQSGYLWTPGFWAFVGASYLWHAGYWGEHVGFYGGINYGHGYGGHGYEGGRWNRGVFQYNTQVNNVNTTVVHNVYNTTIVNQNNTRVSFNGRGGVLAQPNAQDLQAQGGPHIAPVALQQQHERAALRTPQQSAAFNHGTPQFAATPRPGAFGGGAALHGATPTAQFHGPSAVPRPPGSYAQPRMEQRNETFQGRPLPQALPPAARPQPGGEPRPEMQQQRRDEPAQGRPMPQHQGGGARPEPQGRPEHEQGRGGGDGEHRESQRPR